MVAKVAKGLATLSDPLDSEIAFLSKCALSSLTELSKWSLRLLRA